MKGTKEMNDNKPTPTIFDELIEILPDCKIGENILFCTITDVEWQNMLSADRFRQRGSLNKIQSQGYILRKKVAYKYEFYFQKSAFNKQDRGHYGTII